MSIPAAISMASQQPTLSRNIPFIHLFTAYTLSIFGNSFHSIAINLWVLSVTGSAKLMTVMMVTNLVLGALLGTVAGTVTDRMNRRTVIMVADLLRFAVVLLIAFCVAMPHTPFAIIAVLSAFVTVLGLFQSPALQASITPIVGKAHVQRAVGLMNISDNIARTIGFAVGGIFVAAFGGAWAIAIDAVMYLASFLLVWSAGSLTRISVSDQTMPNTSGSSFRAAFMDGLRSVRSNPFAKSVMILIPSLLLFFMTAFMLTQVMAVKIWHASPFEFGLIEACIPIGYMAGSGLIVMLGSRMRHRGKWIMINLMLLGPLYMLLARTESAAAAFPLIVLIGFMFSFCTLLINIILRVEVAEELQGRMFGALGSLTGVAPSLGLVLSSYYADLYGSGLIMLIVGGLMLLFGLAANWRLSVIRNYH
ncbi:MFS transporter [Paenibacillus lignilyticus]|uniref:MFS transporter n=1 Tax=Paenibacillus lignilyticus TaxID=1172615 RepID=A0ABS5C5T8_9BACL|nr:MFS transporter [Paenibacillus lignilyticus]MBP3961358.1 MFS transporter [Paenibacillus lignilyticus]